MKRLVKLSAAILLIIAILCVAVACNEKTGSQTQNPDDVAAETPIGDNTNPNDGSSSGSGSSSAQDNEEDPIPTVETDGTCNYKLNADKTAYSVKSASDTSSTTIFIPSAYNDKPVVSIESEAFRKNLSLRSVSIPSSVKSISSLAFSGCRSLESVTFEANSELESIDFRAFYECECLNNLVLPEGLRNVGAGAFDGCVDLETLSVPQSVERIGARAFECKFLSNIHTTGIYYFGKVAYAYLNPVDGDPITLQIKEGTLSVAGEAFMGLGNVSDVIIPASVNYIGKDAFTSATVISFTAEGNENYRVECGALIENGTDILIRGTASATIADSVKAIGENAFKDVKALLDIVIPISVKAIGASAFEGCSSLRGITLPNSVTVFEDGVFRDCNALEEICISYGVTKIWGTAFSGCSSLKTVYIDSPEVILICNMKLDAGHLLEYAETVYVSDNAFDIEIPLKDEETGEIVTDPETGLSVMVPSVDPRKKESDYLVAFFTKGESYNDYTVWNINPQ